MTRVGVGGSRMTTVAAKLGRLHQGGVVRGAPGDRVMRPEDPPLLRGSARYVGDLPTASLHAVFVRSTSASAVIRSIDTTEAAAMPDVVAVARAGELGLPMRGPSPGMVAGVQRPLFAHDVVRHVGEIVAVVVAESFAAAVDAAEHVVVDRAIDAPVVNPWDAVLPQAHLLHASMSSNVSW